MGSFRPAFPTIHRRWPGYAVWTDPIAPASLNVALAACLPARIGHVAPHRWSRPSENGRPASSQSSRPLCHFTAVLRPHFIPFFLREEVLHMTRIDNGV